MFFMIILSFDIFPKRPTVSRIILTVLLDTANDTTSDTANDHTNDTAETQ